MLYQISHRTTYHYSDAIRLSQHLARLTPRQSPQQTLLEHSLEIYPTPDTLQSYPDYFGNVSTYFSIQEAHLQIKIISTSKVQRNPNNPILIDASPPWEFIRETCQADILIDDTLAGEFSYPSPFITPLKQFADYALLSFTPGRSIFSACKDLNSRLYHDFKFDPKATDIATPVLEAFEKRRGVCQDFAHIMIACLRSIGIPVKYVSGYLETLPPPGQQKLIGSDASHAWVSAWCGGEVGWVEFDPTNHCLPDQRHLTLACGRDFFDVSPLKGVVTGNGNQTLHVEVDVIPLSDEEAPPNE